MSCKPNVKNHGNKDICSSCKTCHICYPGHHISLCTRPEDIPQYHCEKGRSGVIIGYDCDSCSVSGACEIKPTPPLPDTNVTTKLVPVTVRTITHNPEDTYRILVDLPLVGSETPTPYEFDTVKETAAKMDVGQIIYIERPELTPVERLDEIDRIIEEGEA